MSRGRAGAPAAAEAVGALAARARILAATAAALSALAAAVPASAEPPAGAKEERSVCEWVVEPRRSERDRREGHLPEPRASRLVPTSGAFLGDGV